MSIPKRYNEHSRHFYMVTPPPPRPRRRQSGNGFVTINFQLLNKEKLI